MNGPHLRSAPPSLTTLKVTPSLLLSTPVGPTDPGPGGQLPNRVGGIPPVPARRTQLSGGRAPPVRVRRLPEGRGGCQEGPTVWSPTKWHHTCQTRESAFRSSICGIVTGRPPALTPDTEWVSAHARRPRTDACRRKQTRLEAPFSAGPRCRNSTVPASPFHLLFI